MNIKKIKKQIAILKSYKTAAEEENLKSDSGAELEGLGFRYKTVQYHIINDCFLELQKHPETFGDVKIYAERFSLPDFGEKNDTLDGTEYQFETILLIESKTGSGQYFNDLNLALTEVEEKHDVDTLVEQYEEGDKASYNIHRITFYTKKKGVFAEK